MLFDTKTSALNHSFFIIDTTKHSKDLTRPGKVGFTTPLICDYIVLYSTKFEGFKTVCEWDFSCNVKFSAVTGTATT